MLDAVDMEAPWHATPEQIRRSSAGRQWHGLSVWHQVGPEGDLYIPPQHDHCILLRRSTPTSLIYRRGPSIAHGPWRPGDALIVPAGMPSFWRSGAVRDNVHIAIDPVWLSRAAGADVRLRSELCRHDPVLASFAGVLLASLDSSTSMQPCFAEHIALGIAVHLLAQHADPPPYATSALTRRQMDTLADAIAEGLDQKWPLARLAALLDLSPFHFARSFKAAFGTPPHAYVSGQRMAAGARLLRSTRKTVEQIAVATGYASAAHFTHAFRQHWGITPTAYRRGHE